MKYFILVFLCTVGLSAQAQWWRVGPLKHKRYPQLAAAKYRPYKHFPVAKISTPKINKYAVALPYNFSKQEAFVMRTAQHNMRFRVYNAASYNFSDLAQLYIQQGRLSEAKWYLLQSILISRKQMDDRHTFNNLVLLAAVKIDMGDVNLARQDLLEAREMAATRGWIREAKDVDLKLKAIQGINTLAPKADLKYAEAVELAEKSK